MKKFFLLLVCLLVWWGLLEYKEMHHRRAVRWERAQERAKFGPSASEVKKYKQTAKQGDVEAQLGLGDAYVKGVVVRQDYAQARYWYEQAAAQGNAEAMFRLGRMYSEGEGVLNKRAAKAWYGKACDAGDQFGCRGYRRLNEAGF